MPRKNSSKMNHNIYKKSEEFSNIIRHQKKEILLKFLVIGDFGVGKTSIIKRYAEGTFSSVYKITIGADFAIKSLSIDDNILVHIQLWDIAGSERFGYLTRVYYKYAVAAAIVFDLTRPETYKSVEKWLTDLRLKVTLQNGKPLPVILLANKGDMNLSNIPPDIIEFCQKHNILAWFITSAKENTNIEEAFECLLEAAMRSHENENCDEEDLILIKKEEPIKRLKYCCK